MRLQAASHETKLEVEMRESIWEGTIPSELLIALVAFLSKWWGSM